MDRLYAMETFLHVVEQGSFSRAAERIGRSKAVVSKTISHLEDRLGIRLLNRTTRRISLTEAGTEYYEHCQRIVAEVNATETALTDLQKNPRGKLRLTAPMTFGTMHITPLVAEFCTRYPDIEIELELNDRHVDMVDEGYDLAVRIGRLNDSTLRGRKLVSCGIKTIAAPSYLELKGEPREPQDLSKHNCLLYSYASDLYHWSYIHSGEAVRVPVNGNFKSNNGRAVLEACIAGLGITVLPDFICGPSLKQGLVKEILVHDHRDPVDVYVLYPANRYVAGKVRAFIDFIVEKFATKQPWHLETASRSY
jgi:DNA-binding transcriptional LysR family regulator